MTDKEYAYNVKMCEQLLTVFLTASVDDPFIIIKMSNFIRSCSLSDEEKSQLLDFYALLLTDLGMNLKFF